MRDLVLLSLHRLKLGKALLEKICDLFFSALSIFWLFSPAPFAPKSTQFFFRFQEGKIKEDPKMSISNWKEKCKNLILCILNMTSARITYVEVFVKSPPV